MAQPLFAHRELYAPGHFGNSYEVAGELQMRELLSEAAWWGFNAYSDWFDMLDCSDPFAGRKGVGLAEALWDRKKTHFRSARSLGLDCGLVITPNHVYVDQCRPDLLAVAAGRIFGQLICPSKPQARETILRNYANLFDDLAASGIRLDALAFCPYDYGGCACDACRPWILTFARLAREIHELAARRHPGIEAHLIGWWWEKDEHDRFAEWADREAPGWARSVALHIPYGETNVSEVPLPRGCERRAFVHIGYADTASPRDVYGHTGPVVAADRLGRTVANLAAQGVTGAMAYSEGVCDDLNKALLAGLSGGRFRTAEAALRRYVARYLGAAGNPALARRWAAWLRAWGRPFEVDADAAARAMRSLSRKAVAGTWRFRQWQLKAEMFRQHARIGDGKAWTPKQLAAADAFRAAQEMLQRDVWGLGPLRHVLARSFTPLPWYKPWAEHTAGRFRAMSQEA